MPHTPRLERRQPKNELSSRIPEISRQSQKKQRRSIDHESNKTQSQQQRDIGEHPNDQFEAANDNSLDDVPHQYDGKRKGISIHVLEFAVVALFAGFQFTRSRASR